MSEEQQRPSSIAKIQVEKCRKKGHTERLAEALEDLASALIKEVDLLEAVSALEEAADLWNKMKSSYRQGSCLLLAASTARLAGEVPRAKHNLDMGMTVDLPRRLMNGFQVEWCEQEFVSGRYDSSFDGFTDILSSLGNELEPIPKAQLYQRRAAAAAAGQKWLEAANDLLKSSTIFQKQGLHADSEASALAAAAILADVAPTSAEQVLSEISATVPIDGAAATRRGLVGGKVAMQSGLPALALERFDKARQGALDVGDPVSYLTAAVEASNAAELLEDFETAYARLATAWVSLSDVVGAEKAAAMVKPSLQKFKKNLGTELFSKIKQQYEQKRQG